jgi:hypothetical protein
MPRDSSFSDPASLLPSDGPIDEDSLFRFVNEDNGKTRAMLVQRSRIIDSLRITCKSRGLEAALKQAMMIT